METARLLLLITSLQTSRISAANTFLYPPQIPGYVSPIIVAIFLAAQILDYQFYRLAVAIGNIDKYQQSAESYIIQYYAIPKLLPSAPPR